MLDETQYHRVNDHYIKALGWSFQELTSQPFYHFIHPDDLAATQKVAQEGTTSSCILNFKNRHRTKAGDDHLIEWFTLVQVAGSNRDTPMLAIGRDLTVEAQLSQQQKDLEQAQIATRLKSGFVAHMSHEVRTPLNGIIGFLERALEEPMSPLVRAYVEQAQQSSHFLLGIANDIIDVSKIEAGNLTINHDDFNPHSVIKSVLAVSELQASKKNLILTSKIDLSLPPVLRGDENRFKQILFNLLNNAIKYTDQGKITLKITGKSQQHSTAATFLLQGQLQDTGHGMAPEFMAKLFQPFSQEDHSMKRQFSGAGLGLYITKQLCERLGGTINVLSTPGVGSTFQFHLVLAQPQVSPPSSSAPSFNKVPRRLSIASPVNRQALSSTISEMPPALNILVVEDNLINQKMMLALLKKLGHTVDIAENGLLGVQATQRKAYDLILMDGEMPVMDGLEATRQIRQQFSPQQLPIIGVSAHAMSSHRDIFLNAGMDGYVSKPVTKNILLNEIAQCFKTLSITRSPTNN